MGSDESLVSFDLTSLFADVPTEEAVGVILSSGMAILEPSYDQLRNNKHPESLTTTMTTKPRGLQWPTFHTWQALLRGSGRCAGTSTSERCLSPGPPSAAFSLRSKTPLRQPGNRTSSTRYHAPAVRCTLEKQSAG